MDSDKKTQKKSEDELETMNYNDRPDGYGFGEAECLDDSQEYEEDEEFCKHCVDMGEGYRKHKGEPYTKDENGLRNQYGPVDQYVFRDVHISRNSKKSPIKSKELKEEKGA